MSYGVQAYAIDVAALKKAIGSGDALLAKRLTKKFAHDLESTDEIDFEEGHPSAAECLTALIVEGPPERGRRDAAPGYKYGYALQILCHALGEWQRTSVFAGIGSHYFEALDASLKRAKSKRRLTNLVFNGSPVPLPLIEDFPVIGGVAAADVEGWRGELAALLGAPPAPPQKSAKAGREKETAFSGRVEGKKLVVSAAGKKTVTSFPTNKAAQKALITALRKSNSVGAKPASASPVDEEALDGLRELLSWLDATAAKKLGLVTFYY